MRLAIASYGGFYRRRAGHGWLFAALAGMAVGNAKRAFYGPDEGGGESMRQLVIYVHGKGGSAEEAAHYRPLFPDCDVVGLDYEAQTPWEAKEEFPRRFDALSAGADAVILIANSIGAYFSMHALPQTRITRALLVSPIVDMERLIQDMMGWSGVTEDELRRRGEIPTAFGETLSWAYLSYVRAHPLRWRVPTAILYGGRDSMTSRETVGSFAQRTGAQLTIVEDGEHWFHTEEQMAALDRWAVSAVRSQNRHAAGGIADEMS